MLFMSGFFSEEPERGDVPSRLGRLALLRLAGRGMDRYITLDGLSWSQDETSMTLPEGWPEPNVTAHKSYEFFSYDWDEELGLDYTFNNDGTVAAISASATMQKIKKEFDIVVGNEPIRPEHPENFIYQASVQEIYNSRIMILFPKRFVIPELWKPHRCNINNRVFRQ